MEIVQLEMTALLSANVFLDGMALTVRRVSGETNLKGNKYFPVWFELNQSIKIVPNNHCSSFPPSFLNLVSRGIVDSMAPPDPTRAVGYGQHKGIVLQPIICNVSPCGSCDKYESFFFSQTWMNAQRILVSMAENV